MRPVILLAIFGVSLAHAMVAQAQQVTPGDVLNMFGKVMDAAAADAKKKQAQDQWQAADPELVACLQQRLGLHPDRLGARGIGPYDPRLRPRLIQCDQWIKEEKRNRAQSADIQRRAAQDAWARLDASTVKCFDDNHSPPSGQLASQGIGPRDRSLSSVVDRCARSVSAEREKAARKKAERDAEIEKKKQDEAARRADAEHKAAAEKQKQAQAEKLAADTKKRDELKASILSNPKLSFLADGAPDDLIAIVNVGDKAPHAVVDLHGKLTFTENAAVLCMPGGVKLSPIETRLYKDHLAVLNVSADKVRAARCDRLAALGSIDLLVLRRAAILQSDVADVGVLVEGIGGDHFIKGFVIAQADIKAAEDKREVETTALKNGIQKGTKKGYGVIVIPNDGQLFCNTAGDLAKIFPDLSRELMTTRDFEKVDPQKLQPADIDTDTAFISIKKDRCRAVFGNADSLRTLMVGLDRDHVPYAIDGRWISSDTVTAYLQGKSEQERKHLQEEAETKQRLAAEAELMEHRAEATGKVKADQQRALRAANEPRVKSLKDQYLKDMELFVHSSANQVPSTTLGRLFPDLTDVYRTRLTEGWEYEAATVDVVDYGMTTWKGRVLEAFVVRSKIKILHRELGERREICYTAGYINDVEFQMLRSPLFSPCEDGDLDLKKWEASYNFVSKWNVE